MAEATAVALEGAEKLPVPDTKIETETIVGGTDSAVASEETSPTTSEAEETEGQKKEPATMDQTEPKESPQDETTLGEENVDLDTSSKENVKPEPNQEEKKEDDGEKEASEIAKEPTEAVAKEEESKEPTQQEETALESEPAPSERGRTGPSLSPPRHHHPARLHPPANSHASTEIVQSLFGPSVGLCWGDFSCQYNHVRGRLYASSEAVLFYSNIFGFEKKINLRYEDVLQMSLYRQTSIQVSAQDDNKQDESGNESANYYIFKGFSDRAQTLQLLIELWRQSQGVDENMQVMEAESTASDNAQDQSTNLNLSPFSGQATESQQTPPRPPSILKASTPPSARVSPTRVDPTTNANPVFPDLPSSRKRSKSVPNLQRRRPKERSKSEGAAGQPRAVENAAAPSDDDVDWNQAPTKSDQAAWEAAKKSADPWIKEVGVEPIELSCSLGTFYKLFLANDAGYSMEKYQRGDLIKDLDVNISPWVEDASQPNTLVRTIDFRHPCGSFGVGPSHAPTKKRQLLRRFPGCGISVAGSTTVEGLPGADCFVVEDLWLIEVNPNNPRVTFSAKFGANFTKRTFLKSIIQKNIKSGNKEWYEGYKQMVQSALKENKHLEEEQVAPSDEAAEKEEDTHTKAAVQTSSLQHTSLLEGRTVLIVLMTSQLLLFLVMVVVVNQISLSNLVTQQLLEEMKLLRLEHGQVLGLLVEKQTEQEVGLSWGAM